MTSSDSRKCAYTSAPIISRASGSSSDDMSTGARYCPCASRSYRQQRLLLDVVHAAKPFGAADRPVHRRGGDPERALEIVQQLQRIARRAVELVDERENRQPVAPAHLEQLPCLILDAVGRVDHHHDAVGGDERAVGVLAEILVARRVEQRHAPSPAARIRARRT